MSDLYNLRLIINKRINMITNGAILIKFLPKLLPVFANFESL